MGKSAPSAPDPMRTAAAQSGMNRDTAITEMQLNTGAQHNPWGSITYDKTGEESFVDSQGRTVTTPTYSQTTSLTPEQQVIFDQSQAAEGNLAGIANQQSSYIKEHLSQPFEFTNDDASQWAYDLASPRIMQQQGQNEASLRSTLANKGIREGSAAWDAELGRLTNANSDQLNQLALTGRGQAFGEAMATRNQPLNEITALLSGSQVSNPAQMGAPTPQVGVGGVDYAGLVQNQYAADSANHQAKMGGLFGMAGAGIQAASMFSDRRLKRDIKQVGATGNGLPWYKFRYVWDGADEPLREGLMSDDVRKVAPNAVIVDAATGFDKVQYDLAMGA